MTLNIYSLQIIEQLIPHGLLLYICLLEEMLIDMAWLQQQVQNRSQGGKTTFAC